MAGFTSNISAGGQMSGFIFATCAEHGSVLWERPVEPPIEDFAVHAGKVFVPAGDRLLVLDAVTGHEKWTRSVSQSGDVTVTPDGTSVIVAIREPGKPRKIEVYAIDDGSVRWDTAFSPGVEVFFACGPEHVHVADLTPAGLGPGYEPGLEVRTFSLRTGQVEWSRRLPWSGTGGMRVSGSSVLCHVGDDLVALNASTGKTSWKLPILSAGVTPQIRDYGERLIVGSFTSRYGNCLFDVDPAEGRVLRHTEVTNTISEISPVVDDIFHVLISGGDVFELFALNTETHSRLWRKRVEKDSVLVTGEGAIYVIGRQIAAHEAATGIKL